MPIKQQGRDCNALFLTLTLKYQFMQQIKATANHSKRTFTLRKEDGTKYRTIKLSKAEFQSCLNNTQNDWKQFFRSNDYYLVKR